MNANLVVVRNPFHPAKDREQYAVSPGQTFADLAPKAGVFIMARNGEYVLRKDWQTEIADGDIVNIVFLPRGGGRLLIAEVRRESVHIEHVLRFQERTTEHVDAQALVAKLSAGLDVAIAEAMQ